MKLIKLIYKDNTLVNTFVITDNEAKTEFINLLLDKIKKRYKITISLDHIHREAKAKLYFNQITNDGKTIKYCYEYNFYDIDNDINLY